MAKIFMAIGATFFLVGLLLYFFPHIFSWFGRLPGDIRVERENGAFYFPVVTMIVISLLLSVGLSLAAHFFRR